MEFLRLIDVYDEKLSKVIYLLQRTIEMVNWLLMLKIFTIDHTILLLIAKLTYV